MKKYLYIALGFVSLSLGILGFVTPGLPVTPFLLLTAFLFSKSSPRLHQKLMANKVTGPYIHRIHGGLSLKARLASIAFMWLMICITAFVVFDAGTMRFVMLGLGVVGTIAQLLVLRKRKKEEVIVELINPPKED